MKDIFRSDKVRADLQKNLNPGYLDNIKIGKPVGKYWRVVRNQFPYDNVATKHDLLVLGRIAPTMKDLTVEETEELWRIWGPLSRKFDSIMLNSARTQSIPKRLHFHLIKWKYRDPPKKV